MICYTGVYKATKGAEAQGAHLKAMVEFEDSFGALVSVLNDPLDEYILAFCVGVFHRGRDLFATALGDGGEEGTSYGASRGPDTRLYLVRATRQAQLALVL